MEWPAFLSDLIAGLVGAVILGGLAILFRYVGPERGRQWASRLRRLGWPLLTFVFFATALMSYILRPPPRPISVALVTFVALVSASFIPLRFVPEKIRRLKVTTQTYAWPILTGIFLLSTVVLLLFGIIGPRERITFVVNLADQELLALRNILDGAERKLGAEVFLVNVDRSRYVARLDHMVASGKVTWDLIALDNTRAALVVEKGLVEELARYADYDELIPSELLLILEPLLKYEEKWYFAPFRPNVKIAFYNEPKFAQYGLRPPMTWEELLEVAKVFYEEEGVGRVAIQGHPGPASAVTVFEFVTAAGGDPTSLDDDGSWEAFEFLQKLEPYLAPEYVETRFDTANELLIDDKVYLVSNWTFGIKVVVEDAGKKEIKAYRGWRGPQEEDHEVHVLGGDLLAIPKGAPHAEAAVKLIEFLISEETQSELVARPRWPPVRLDVYNGISGEMKPYFKAVREALTFAKARPNAPQWLLQEECLAEAFKQLVIEGKDLASLEQHIKCLEKIPSKYFRYPVVSGDKLKDIADRYNTTVVILAQANGMTPWTSLATGQILLIPQR